MLPNEGCTRRRPSRFVRSGKTEFRATAVRGSRTGKKVRGLTRFIRPSIAPTAVKINQCAAVHSRKTLAEVLLFRRGAQGHALANRRGATRWAREVSRHVVVLHGHAARTGGDVELFHRRSRYAPARLPLVAETLPIRGSVSAGFPDRVARALVPGRARPPADRPAISARTHRVSRREPASRRPALATVDSLRASRASLVSSSCFPRLTLCTSVFHLNRRRAARGGPPHPRVLREHENRASSQPARGRQGAPRRQLTRARGGGETVAA